MTSHSKDIIIRVICHTPHITLDITRGSVAEFPPLEEYDSYSFL